MKQLQPVLWTKGTFLTPQHLQLQDRFLEDSLNFRLQALKFCAWGFSEVVLDQELLADGHLAVSRASGIFPDGLLFDIPGSDQPPPSKALAEFFDPGVRDLDIYLTVPDYRQKGLNVSARGPIRGSRYLAEITTVIDENTGTGEKPIQIARKNLRLLAANETREGSSALRIANVERTDAGVFRLNTRFVPPLLEVRASDFLLGLVNGLLEILSAKSTPACRQPAAEEPQPGRLHAHRTSQISGCCIPSIRIFPCSATCCRGSAAIQKSSSPRSPRSALRSPPFPRTIRPRDLPLYDHLESEQGLHRSGSETTPAAGNRGADQCRLSAPQACKEHHLRHRDRPGQVPQQHPNVPGHLHRDSEDSIIRKVPQMVKVCSATDIERLISLALPGVVTLTSLA